jgi:hypothetical protein
MPDRSLSRCSLLAALALLGSSAPAVAQAVTSNASTSRPSHAAQLKGALKGLVAAQAKHHAAKRSYAASMDALPLPPAPGVRIEIVAAGGSGWQARARHRDQPGRSCVVFVGSLDGAESPRTDGDREMAGEEGVPLCDRMR